MLSIETIRWLLAEASLKKVSVVTKIPYNTLYRIMNKEDANPSYQTIKKLSDYLENKIHKTPKIPVVREK